MGSSEDVDHQPLHRKGHHFVKRRTVQNRGFTLIEIMVVIVMAAILLPAMIVPFVSAVRRSGKPEMATTAMYLCQQKMEEFVKWGYSHPSLNPTALTTYADAELSGYQWQWEIVYVDHQFNLSASNVGYKRIMVRVKDKENDTYELYAVVTRY